MTWSAGTPRSRAPRQGPDRSQVPPAPARRTRPARPGDRLASQAGGHGLPDILLRYLLAEQRLGRIDPAADVAAASTLLVGAIHGQVLPRVLFAAPGTPFSAPPGLGAKLAQVVLDGLAPKAG